MQSIKNTIPVLRSTATVMFPAPPNFSAAVHPLTPFGFGATAPFNSAANVPQTQFLADPLQGAELTSPELLKNNIRLVQQQILELQTFSRRVLAAIQNAYQTGNSPAHTEADIATLKQMLTLVIDTMRQTGVGALPVLDNSLSGMATVPTEFELLASITKNLRVLYDRLQKRQSSAADAANLLSLDHGAARTSTQQR